MSTIHFHKTTTSTPEQFIAGLTDFGPGRSKLFTKSADAYLKVHHQGPHEADVTEGSGGVWERLHYDWSDPDHVKLTTTDSNIWGGASGYTYTFGRQPDGTTDVDVVVVREGKNLKGRVLGGSARNHRQARIARGVRTQRQGHRSPQQRKRRGPLVERLRRPPRRRRPPPCRRFASTVGDRARIRPEFIHRAHGRRQTQCYAEAARAFSSSSANASSSCSGE